MIKHLTHILSIVSCSMPLVFGQANPIGEYVSFPSPQAAQFGRFGGAVTNHSTGTPSLDIPLYTAREGDIQLPIALHYGYDGFKPAYEPGWVGLGWNLEVGGSISRIVKGTADEIVSGQMAKVKTLVDALVPDQSKYQALGLQTTSPYYYLESEPDVFSFNFMGHSGRFVLDHNRVPKLVSNQPLEFSFSTSGYGPEYKQMITSWTVTDGSGTSYRFNAFEASYANENELYYFPTAWYLTEVTDAKGNRISLEYTAKNPTSEPRVQAGVIDQAMNASYESNIFMNYSLEVYPTKINGSLWEVELVSTKLYHSLNGESNYYRKLDAIKVYDTSASPKSLSRQFGFTYLDTGSYKLTLASVGEAGLPPHAFTYYNPVARGFNGTSRRVDAWGYYNNRSNHILIEGEVAVDLQPNLAATRYGAIQKATYPTGGTTEWEYELNDYSYEQNQPTTKTTTSYENHHFIFTDATGGSLHYPGTAFTLTQYTDVEIQVHSDDSSPSSCRELASRQYTNGTNGWRSFNLAPGSYSGDDLLRLPGFSPCNDVFGPCSEPGDPCGYFPPEGYYVTLDVRVIHKTQTNRPVHGGIRVSKITETPVGGQLATPFVTEYTYNRFDNAALSSGAIVQEPVYKLTIPSSFTSGAYGEIRIKRSNAFNPLSMSPISYEQVRESTPKGYTKRQFTGYEFSDVRGRFALMVDFQDYPNDGSTGIKNFAGSTYTHLGDFESLEFMRGLPRSVQVYDSGGNLKVSTEYSYLSAGPMGSNLAASFYHERLATYDYWRRGTKDEGYMVINSVYYGKAYYVLGGWPRKYQETIKVYESNSTNPQITTIKYAYGNAAHAQVTQKRTSHSDGRVSEENIRYSKDYESVSGKATFLQQMIDAHMWTQPIEQTKIWDKGSGVRQVLSAGLTTYKSLIGNTNKSTLILPYKHFLFKADGNLSFTNYSGTTFESAASYHEKVKFANYDTFGNPLHLQVSGGAKLLSYLWSYKSRFPVAAIEGAAFGEVTAALSAAGSSVPDLGNRTSSTEINSILSGIRAQIPNKHMVHYLYKPNFGMSRMVDAAGKATSYAYDGHARLSMVTDNQGKPTDRWGYLYSNGSGTPITPSNLSWDSRRNTCTNTNGSQCQFKVFVTGIGSSATVQFSLDNANWFAANLGADGYVVNVPYGSGGSQAFYARPSDNPSGGKISGSILKCAYSGPPSTPTIALGSESLCSITLTASGCNGTVNWSNGAAGSATQVPTATKINYTATCTTSGGTSGPSNTLALPALPSGFSAADIGNPPIRGCSRWYKSASGLQISGSGNIGSGNDKFHWIYKTQTGDVTVVAKLENSRLQTSENFGQRSGIMIRASNAANSPYYMLIYDVDGHALGKLVRNTSSDSDHFLGYAPVQPGGSSPLWIRLKKSGSTYTAWYAKQSSSPSWNSDSGWTQIPDNGDSTVPNPSLGSSFLVGLGAYNGSTATGSTLSTFYDILINGNDIEN